MAAAAQMLCGILLTAFGVLLQEVPLLLHISVKAPPVKTAILMSSPIQHAGFQ